MGTRSDGGGGAYTTPTEWKLWNQTKVNITPSFGCKASYTMIIISFIFDLSPLVKPKPIRAADGRTS